MPCNRTTNATGKSCEILSRMKTKKKMLMNEDKI